MIHPPSSVASSLPRLHESFSQLVRASVVPLVYNPLINGSRGLTPAIGCAVVKTDDGSYGMHAEGLRYFPSLTDPTKPFSDPRKAYDCFELDHLKNQTMQEERAKQVFVDPAVDRWHWGSNLKSLSATTIVLCLQDKGLHPMVTTVGDVLGDSAAVPEALKTVTIQQLLDHRSGLDDRIDVYGINFTSMDGWRKLWWAWGTTYVGASTLWAEHRRLDTEKSTAPHEQRQVVLDHLFKRWKASKTFKPEQKRGKFNYSNFGFALAAHCAEKISSVPFEEAMRTKLFEPLGMSTAGFGEPSLSLAAGVPNVRGHDHDFGWHMGTRVEKLKYHEIDPPNGTALPPALNPAGNVHSTLLDFCRWELYQAAQLQEHVAESKKRQKVSADGNVAQYSFFDTSACYDSPANPEAPWNGYSSGLIKLDEVAQVKAQLDEEGKSKRKSDQQQQQDLLNVKNMLGRYWMHDGSNGAWHAAHIIVPRKKIAGVICANTSNVELPAALLQALRAAMLEVLDA